MTDDNKIYCPKIIAALLPTIAENPILTDEHANVVSEGMRCLKDECGYFSKKHNCCAIVAIADKPPLTVALDIPEECGDVEGWDNK